MIQELHAGDRQIPASGWNEMRAAVQGITPGQQQYQSGRLNPVYVTIKNTTGSALPAFAVVKINGATYSSRTGSDFKDLAIKNGVELNGYTPAAATDTIAITQEACPAGGLVRAMLSGATACIINKAVNINYQYAATVAGQTGYLTGSDVVTGIKVLWVASGAGDKEAYVLLDNVAEGEYFIINPGNDGTQTATHTPSIFTKGSLHYVSYNETYNAWIPDQYNEAPSTSTLLQRPAGSRLVVCQIDAPNSAAECRIPYFTPESNMGIAPLFASSMDFGNAIRCGCKPGEHLFTNKMCDYSISSNSGANSAFREHCASYEYNPQFIANVTVSGNVGGANDVYADICGNNWLVIFPGASAGLSAANYPDIYPYDQIAVQVDCEQQQCWAIDYPTDYESGIIMAYYATAPGRGWDSSIVTTPQALADVGLTLYQKVKTGAIL